MQIKCDYCGTEQFIKDYKFNKYYREDFDKAVMVLCGRNDCDKSQIKIPKGYIRCMFWLGDWSLVREATLDEYRAVKRAIRLKEKGEKLCNPSL